MVCCLVDQCDRQVDDEGRSCDRQRNPYVVWRRIVTMTSRTTSRTVAVLAAALLTLTACRGDDSSGTDGSPSSIEPAATSGATAAIVADDGSDADDAKITISRSRFSTTELRVTAGTTVTFVNTDEFAHTVTSSDGTPVPFDSGQFGLDESFEFTFDEPGEYPFFCQIHPTMRAVVIVE